jgi:tol-pal system protein YbgF
MSVMKQRLSIGTLALVFAMSAASPMAAANKEHQQLMADLRMLQEQSQLLQTLLGTLTEALKAVNTRLDQQTEVNRKSFADSKLVIDNLTNDVRVIREKLDDNNVRIGSLTQEVNSLRQSMQQMSGRPSTTEPDAAAGSPAAGGAPAAGGGLIDSPEKTWNAAWADYTAGQYDLAIMGFEAYIRDNPRSDKVDDAQMHIGNSYLNAGKNDKAVEAYDKTIRAYPSGNVVPDAYYKKGLALMNMKNVAAAREAWEFVVKNYPNSDAATQARQRLQAATIKPD